MGIAEVEKQYMDDLVRLNDAGSQCDYLMMLGLRKTANTDVKTDHNRIGGCKTAIWFRAEIREEHVWFTGDSDSLLVRGILAVFGDMYQAQHPQDVRAHPPRFLAYVSDEVIYPEIKENGLLKCYQRLAALSIN